MSTWVAVTGSQDPYVFDLPHVLSLPPGFEFRFRYRHKWVSKAVHTKLKKDAKSFYAQELILCFHSQESRRVIPIRRCQVISVEEIGPVIFLRFSVGAFPQLEFETAGSTDPKPSAASMDKLAMLGRALLGLDASVDLSQPLPRELYLCEAKSQTAVPWCETGETEESDDHARQTARARAWASLVAALGGEPSLHGVPLFHLLGFDREDGAPLPSEPIKNKFSMSKTPIHGFELTEGERYRLRLLEWCDHKEGEPQPAFRVNCEFANVGLDLEGASNLVVGRYDVLEYTLIGERPGYGEILIRAEALETKAKPPGGPASAADPTSGRASEANLANPSAATKVEAPAATPGRRAWPAIYMARVPVSVAHARWKVVALGVSMLVGLVFYLVVAPKLAASPYWKGPVELVGLLLLSPLFRHIEKLFKLREGIKKWNEPPKSGKD